FISLIGYIASDTKNKFIPYLVTVDKQGSILSVGKVQEQRVIPSQVVSAYLCDFIETLHTKTTDSALQLELINKVYAAIALNSNAQKVVDEHYQQKNYLKQDLVSEQAFVDSIVGITNESVQIEFFIKTIKSNEEIVKDYYTALISYKIDTPNYTQLELLRLNPIGLFIYDLNISKKMQRLEA
ncbi:MAG TPA: hypothetical protein DCQ86_07230, partial [Succinivibrio sp.]|nr:hypothetical protein [Succinivibrio sp.]